MSTTTETKILLTNSRAECFKKCRRRHWYEYEMGLRPIEDARALRMGSAFHAGLEILKDHRSVEEAQAATAEFYATDQESEEAQYWRDIERTTVETLLSGYAWRWADSPLQVLANEQEFRLPLVNPKTSAASTVWELAGKIDGIVSLEDGRQAVLEHKLLSEDLAPGSDWWKRLQMDSQASLYVYAARAIGRDVATVLYDVCRKPSIQPTPVPVLDEDGMKICLDMDGRRVRNADKKAKKTCPDCSGNGISRFDGTQCPCTLGQWRQTADTERQYSLATRRMTPEEWSQKLVDDVAARPDWYFARVEIPRLDSEVDEFMEETWDVQKTVREAQLSKRWYRTVSRDSCPFCPFFGPCSAKTDVTNGIAPEGFQFVGRLHQELSEEIQT